MTVNNEEALLIHLKRAEQALILVIDVPITSTLTNELQRCLAKGVALHLIISRSQILEIESDPFMLHKILELRRLGAFIYDGVHTAIKNGCVLCLDFIELVNWQEADSNVSYVELEEFLVFIEEFIDSETEYRIDSKDIRLVFSPVRINVLETESIVLEWNVSNAEKIYLKGFGEVNAKGNLKIKLPTSQFISLEATAADQRKKKVIFIQVVQDFILSYEVAFLNPSSKAYTVIPEAEREGVYGVIAGQKVKVSWNAGQSEFFQISPINSNEKIGSYEFLPTGKKEFILETRMQGKLKRKKLTIQAFPIPIFQEKLIPPPSFNRSDYQLALEDHRQKLKDQLVNSGYFDTENKLAEIRDAIGQIEATLVQKYAEIKSQNQNGNIEFQSVKKKVESRILSYFRNDESISETIKSMKKYYD